MNNIISNLLNKWIIFGFALLSIAVTGQATLSAQTVRTIQGTKPTFSSSVENHIDDFDLFGVKVGGTNYYGTDITNISLSNAYPFKNSVAIAPIQQPNNTQYLDVDGDGLKDLIAKNSLTMAWYYTDSSDNLVEFTPTTTDSFCSLTKAGKNGPYKVKISGDLILSSTYGDPNINEYPNEFVTLQPSKTYTILEDAGICYAKPELDPSAAVGVSATQWDSTNGFLTQSNVDINKNFPTTAFYGAKFELVLAKSGIVNQYNWSLQKGSELATLSTSSGSVILAFNTAAGLNPQTAWNYVIGSGTGYTVIVQGEHKTKGYKIQYPFTITKWFTSWDKNQIGTNRASDASAPNVVAGCKSMDGIYRISYAQEVSNAPFGTKAGTAKFTREIGTLLGEWGDANQTSYPNSWAAATTQGNAYKRIWLYDSELNNYCDLHTYNAKYHCIAESGLKNGICTSVTSR